MPDSSSARGSATHILILGNSFIAANDLPEKLAQRLGCEVVAHVRGGARLAEHLNPKTANGKRTSELLGRSWPDVVIMQEMSTAPLTTPTRFQESVSELCERCGAAGAVPLLFATWAYERNCPRLGKLGVTQAQMQRALHGQYLKAARDNGVLLADVGTAFFEASDSPKLYRSDGMHPSSTGTELALEVLKTTLAEAFLTIK